MKRFYVLFSFMLFSAILFAQTHGRVIRMDSLQFVDSTSLAGGSDAPVFYLYDDTVTFQGVVTFNPLYYAKSATSRKATWVQDTSFDAWAGMMVFADPGQLSGYGGDLTQLNNEAKFYDNFVPGYTVKATGRMGHYNNNSQIYIIPIESEIVDIPSTIDTTHIVDPILLTIDMFMKNDGAGNIVQQRVTGEKYEGMFVRFEDVTVVDMTDNGNGRFYWSIQDSKGNKIQIDDNSGYFRNDANASASWCNNYVFSCPSEGTRLKYIQGIIEENGSYGYQINPLLPTDFNVLAAAPYISQVNTWPVVPISTQTVKVTASIIDNDGAINDAKLFYSVGYGNMNFTEVNMTKSGGGYYAFIPAQANDSYVNYWIKAVDDSALVSYFPDSLATGSLYKVLDDGITKISDIQNTPILNGASMYYRDTLSNIQIRGIVTATLDQLSLVAIQDGIQPYSGIFLEADINDGLDQLKLGDSVLITSAIVNEYNAGYLTTLMKAGGSNIQVLAHNRKLPEPVKGLNLDSINAQIKAFSEAYEGMLIEFNHVFIVNQNPDAPAGPYGEWTIGLDTNNPTGIRVDDDSKAIETNFSTDTLMLNQELDFIRGILSYSFYNFKLWPRDKNDIAGYFTDTTTVSVKLLNNQEISIKLYPNPVDDELLLTGELVGSDELTICMYDLTGKKISAVKKRVSGDFVISSDVSQLKKGLYFIEIKSLNGRTSVTRFAKQ
ncbi:T9SS type A sorting domain-containing protein [Bacteroidota bacterium]